MKTKTQDTKLIVATVKAVLRRKLARLTTDERISTSTEKGEGQTPHQDWHWKNKSPHLALKTSKD